jgi:hypothetical protein
VFGTSPDYVDDEQFVSILYDVDYVSLLWTVMQTWVRMRLILNTAAFKAGDSIPTHELHKTQGVSEYHAAWNYHGLQGPFWKNAALTHAFIIVEQHPWRLLTWS